MLRVVAKNDFGKPFCDFLRKAMFAKPLEEFQVRTQKLFKHKLVHCWVFKLAAPKQGKRKRTAFLPGTSNFFGPSYFEAALVRQHTAHNLGWFGCMRLHELPFKLFCAVLKVHKSLIYS